MRSAEAPVVLPNVANLDDSFLFIVGTILNQNISGRIAWRNAYLLRDRIAVTPEGLCKSDADSVVRAIRGRPGSPAIHPFADVMADALLSAAMLVQETYGGDSRSVWRSAKSQADLEARFRRFRQIGPHKAQVAAFQLSEVYADQLSYAPEYPALSIESLCPSAIDMIRATLEPEVERDRRRTRVR